MEPTDLTIEILRSIRDEIRGLGQKIDATNSRVDVTNERLEALERRQIETNEQLEALERRQIGTEIRLATEIVALAGAVKEVRDLLKEGLEMGERMEDHERRLILLEARDG